MDNETRQLIAYAIIALMVVAIVGGFLYASRHSRARKRSWKRYDQKRRRERADTAASARQEADFARH
jgi:hypothetical protein